MRNSVSLKLAVLFVLTGLLGACAHKKHECGCGKSEAVKAEGASCKENHDHSVHEKSEMKEKPKSK